MNNSQPSALTHFIISLGLVKTQAGAQALLIVIGIILLLAAGGIFYISSKPKDEVPQAQLNQYIQQMQQENVQPRKIIPQ